MLQVLDLNHKNEWNELVQSMSEYDFYHLAEYHQLDESGKAQLLYFRNSNIVFAFPVIVREIEGTIYKDIASVYGYAGPVSKKFNPDKTTILQFQNELKAYFDKNNIISAFSRLHPLFQNQAVLLGNFGEIVDVNTTIGLDLTLPEPKQRSQYAHSVRNDINRLEREGIRVKKATTKKEIDAFVTIYQENMRRVNASESYFFSHQYFYDFLKSIPSTLLLVYLNDELISGSLYTACNGIVQSHLSATKEDYMSYSPLKYLWDKIRIWGVKEKMNYLHLGGGYGGQNDSLYEFKSQFSKQRFIFQTWRYIHNKAVYDDLVYQRYEKNIPATSFFPLYRF
jgi:hypothetical protein